MSTEIRRLALGDAGLLRTTRLAALADAPAAFGTSLAVAEARDDDFWQRQASGSLGEQRCATWVAVDAAGDGVGMLTGVDTGSSIDIIQVWVAPSHRATGLVDELFGAVLAWCPHERVDIAVAASNVRAKRAYERLGFRVTGDRPGVNEREIEMTLSSTRDRT